MTPITTTRLEKYFETCRSYQFMGTTSTGVYVKFTLGTGAQLTVFATNAQLDRALNRLYNSLIPRGLPGS